MRTLLHIILLFTTMGVGNLILAVCFPRKPQIVVIQQAPAVVVNHTEIKG